MAKPDVFLPLARKLAGVKPLLGRITRHIGAFVYPPRCIACGEQVASGPGLCALCFANTHFFGPAQCAGCGQGFLHTPEPGQRCTDCLRNPMPWDKAAAVFAYAGTAKRLVLGFKHGDRVYLAPHLARWLAQAGAHILQDADILAPVPLHWRRTQTRRYNQSAELVRRMPLPAASASEPTSGAEHIRRIYTLLSRPKATQSQDGLSRAARHDNLHGKIIVTPRHAATLIGARVVLVDDVLTTGATLSAATAACLAGGAASVNVLVLARVAPRG